MVDRDSGKRIVLTGAASGIGAATAALLRADGDRVISLDRQPAGADVAQHIDCDLADPVSIDAAIAQIEGPIDALLNVAGLPGTATPELVIRVNLLGLRHLTEALLPRIRSGGALVNIASIAGFTWQRHLAEIDDFLACPDYEAGLAWWKQSERDGNAAYLFSKECVVVYTMRLAGPARARGLRCNSVSPGPVDTPILPDFVAQAGEGQMDWVIEQSGRAATPRDIAEVVRFFATGPSRWINGRDLIVDGGFSAGLTAGWIDKNSSPAVQRRSRT